jgi:hypothetical protein
LSTFDEQLLQLLITVHLWETTVKSKVTSLPNEQLWGFRKLSAPEKLTHSLPSTALAWLL